VEEAVARPGMAKAVGENIVSMPESNGATPGSSQVRADR
jgi:hypothetical protein